MVVQVLEFSLKPQKRIEIELECESSTEVAQPRKERNILPLQISGTGKECIKFPSGLVCPAREL